MHAPVTWFAALGIVAIFATTPTGQQLAAQQQANAQQAAQAQAVLAAARQALGGDAAIAAVRSFSVSGSLTMNVGDRNIRINPKINPRTFKPSK